MTNGRCGHFGIRFGTFRGGIRFEGESGFTRVRTNRATGEMFSITQRRRCGSPSSLSPLLRGPLGDASILASCGGESGAGFFAAEPAPEVESFFLATKVERSPELSIFRILSVDGSARHLDVAPGRRSAKVRPPAPFSGRATFRDGQLTGNLEAPLPGAGQVRLSPAQGTLTDGNDFELPKCYPPFYLRGSPATRSLSISRAAIYEAFTRAALTPRARRVFAR